jgi:ATP-binding cassette, subfamily B, bacterial
MAGDILFRLLEPWPLKFVVDRVLLPDAQSATGIAFADRLDPLVLLAASAAAVVLLSGGRALTSYLSTVALALAGNRVLTEVRADLYRHLQRLSLSFHTGARSGDLITRLIGDIGRLQEVAVTAALPLVVNTVTLVGMVAVMGWINWQLTLIALCAFPLYAATLLRLTGRIRTAARKQRRVEGALAALAAESLSAIAVVQSYSLEPTLERAFVSRNRASLKDGVKASRLAAALERRTDLLVGLATGLVLLFGARMVLAGRMTPGDLIVFLSYLKNAFKPMRDVSKYTGRLSKAAASGERVVDILDRTPEVRDRPGSSPAPPLEGAVRFAGVTFGYTAGRPVLEGVDLDVAAGQVVALVGPSGAGKSSIASLLLRLYEPQAGLILLDGTEIRRFTLESVRRQIAVVLQDSVLFAATIGENIAYGDPQASREDVEAAARLANAHGFITALPHGYDTVVGERGATLSGGQRQRIAIARAAIRRAPILILDEPATGLDRRSEEEVLGALRAVSAGRTTFLIAHDLRTVTDADLIAYVEGGRVLECGAHELLLARGGRYAALYERQALVGERPEVVLDAVGR